MTPRERLLQLVQELEEDRVEAMLLILNDPVQISAAAKAEEGKVADSDPFGGIVGMIGDEYDGPTDVSANIHKYVADAIEAGWKR
jgi:hypothetical protein